MFFFVLDSHKFSYRGFTCFCHLKDDQDELIDQLANSSKNDKGILKLYRGGGEIDKVKLSDWTKESESYFTRFFAKRLSDSGIICVPQHAPHKDVVMRTLKEWCLMGNRQQALVVQHFDLSKHLKLIKDRKYNFMKYKNAINPFSCYLVYNLSENIILYLCRDKGDNANINIEQQMNCCRSDLFLFVNVYQDELKLSGVKIVGLVISNSETQYFQLKCELCKVFVISFKLFESTSTFVFWLETFRRWFGISESALHQQDRQQFISFSRKMLSLMACTECEYLPNFTPSVISQMEQACLLLNPEQMEVLYSSNNFVILKGNFGTGKTIILQKRLENLAQKLTKKEIIYYINYDRKSNAFIDVKNFVKHVCPKNSNNIRILENKDGLQMSGIFKSISSEAGQDIKSVHVFIDEYNGEDLTQSEADLLKINLRKEHFKDSIIFIASQPIEKVRIHTFQYPSAAFKSEGNMFHELEDIFRIEELTYVMRTTVQVNAVMEFLQDYLQDKQNKFIHFQSHTSVTSTGTVSFNVPKSSQAMGSLAEESVKSLFIKADNKNENQPQITTLLHQENIGNNQKHLADLSSDSSRVPVLSNSLEPDVEIADTQNCFLHTLPRHDKPSVNLDFHSKKDADLMHGGDDLDLAFKEASKLEVNQDKDTTEFKTTTSYTYVSESEVGHKIQSSNAKLIVPHQSENAFENIVSYSAVLNSLGVCRRRFVIIHFEQYPPPVLIKALDITYKSLNLTFPVSLNVQDFVSKESKYLLVTNFRHVRGMEFENVIVMVDPEEYFLKHYLPEAIARCTSNLSLIMLGDKNLKKEEETIKEIIKLLQQKEPSTFEMWTTAKCEKCRKRTRYYCCNNDKHITCLGINIWSDEFKRMEKHFNPTLPVAVDEAMTATDAEQV